jgi:hypothetical protein
VTHKSWPGACQDVAVPLHDARRTRRRTQEAGLNGYQWSATVTKRAATDKPGSTRSRTSWPAWEDRPWAPGRSRTRPSLAPGCP